jgi:predicted RNA-binding protein with PIN domain
MKVLIDCYNLLHATMPASLAGLEEMGLARVLARSAFAGRPVVIVCDGNPKPHAPAGSLAGISLIYSGPNRSADDVIVDLIAKDHSPRRLMVVSSDRQIQQAARRRRAQAVSAEDFIHMLAPHSASGAGSAAARPTEPLTQDQVERWLEEFGIDGEQPLGDKPWWK